MDDPDRPEERAHRPHREDEGREDHPRRDPSRRARLGGIARRIFREIDEELVGDHEEPEPPQDRPRPEARSEARELFSSLLDTGDKAKTEIVRLVAREVRGYLEALELHKDLHHLLTNYSLEVNASFHLRPLAEKEKREGGEHGVRVGLRPREDAEPTEAGIEENRKQEPR